MVRPVDICHHVMLLDDDLDLKAIEHADESVEVLLLLYHSHYFLKHRSCGLRVFLHGSVAEIITSLGCLTPHLFSI